MSWLERIQRALEEARMKGIQSQRSLEDRIGDFFCALQQRLGIEPKHANYLAMDQGRPEPYNLPIDQAKPMLEPGTDRSGAKVIYAGVALNLPDKTVRLPVFVRVAFRDTPEGLVASFGERTGLLPTDTEVVVDHILEALEGRILTQGVVPPIELGF